MRRMPPNEDHYSEDPVNTTRARRQQTMAGQPQPSPYDEHPEIPRVRRASLYLNAPPDEPSAGKPTRQARAEKRPAEAWEEETYSPPQSRRPRIERERDDWEQETRSITHSRQPQTERKRPRDDGYWEQRTRPAAQSRRPRTQHLGEDEYLEQETRPTSPNRRPRTERFSEDEYPEQETRPAPQSRRPRLSRPHDEEHWEQETRRPGSATSGKISVPRRQYPIAYEPRPTDYHRPQGRPLRRLRRSQHALWAHVQDLIHNRTVILAATILIALIVVVPLLASFTQRQIATAIHLGDTGAVPSLGTGNRPGIGRDTDHPAPPVYATAAYLLDADNGATLYEHNATMHLPMMSTTKLMTGLLATQYGKLDQKITINDAIANDINQLSADSSVMGAKKGETYTLRELLYGLMLPSGNDAAIAIADAISGSVPKFVALMNQRAQELGLHDTHYSNPHGLLDDGHYSSAHDLAVLGKVDMDVPVLRQITGSKTYHVPATNEHAEHFFSNSNQFMWWYPGVDGGKIGWDAGANFVQVISCTRNNHHLIGVTLHTIDWWTDMRDLMNWGFNSFTWLSPREINANVHPIPYAADWNYFARDKRENSIAMGNQGRYYVFTGYSVTQPVLSFFDKNGGLGKLGFPISQPQTTGVSLQQRFEHGTVQCTLTTKQCKLA